MHRDDTDGWVRFYISGTVIVLYLSGPDTIARAQRIADAINHRSASDAASEEG